jgi:TetR/AcrR family transcriptional regulator
MPTKNTVSILTGEGTSYTLRAFEKLIPEVQKKILDAAAGVFAEAGYHYASISNICRNAGISNGALYKYFKNKESLFLAVVDYSVMLVESELYQKYMADSQSIFKAVANLLNGMLRFIEIHLDYISIYCDLGSSSMNRFAAVAAEKYRRVSSVYTIRLVEEGKKSREIGGVEGDIAANLIDSYITFFAYSLVSEYHNNRFNSFFSPDGQELTRQRQIAIIIRSLRQILQR